MNSIDINCDLGESYGHFNMGNDNAVFPHISSCNIACGFHGGDPFHIDSTIRKALKYRVQMGAHPSYPDLAGFGRRKILLSADELKASIKYQVAAIQGMIASLGGKLKYVKAHGALYNSIAHDEQEAIVFLSAIKELNPNLAIMGLAGSPFQEIAQNKGFQYIREGFLDRKYQKDGSLMPRSEEGSVLESVQSSIEQFQSITQQATVLTNEGATIPLKVDSLCIHGDNPLAEQILTSIKKLEDSISIKSILI